MIAEVEIISDLSSKLKLLGDRTRLTILSYLKVRELCVCELVDLLDASQPSVSQHLKKLRVSGIINERKQGTWVYYRLNEELPAYLSGIIDALPDQNIKACDDPNCCS